VPRQTVSQRQILVRGLAHWVIFPVTRFTHAGRLCILVRGLASPGHAAPLTHLPPCPDLRYTTAMHIYQPFILHMAASLARTEFDAQHDFEIAAIIAAQAHTVLFRADQVLALRPALERFAESVEYRLPFESVILQFDHPIPEALFFEVENPEQNDPQALAVVAGMWAESGLALHGWTPTDGDAVAALLLMQTEFDGVLHNQAIAFFASTAINRVHWQGGDLTWLPNTDRTHAENKRTLRNLAVACVAYMTCINLTLEKHAPPEKVQKRRAKDGKPPLLPYYTVEVAPAYREKGETGDGSAKHGFRYDVAGHFRRLSAGRLIWVRPHQRGLAHELYVPSVRKVE
jgi:hypothetical protein